MSYQTPFVLSLSKYVCATCPLRLPACGSRLGQASTSSGLRFDGAIPLIADESCHTAADVARLAPFYDGVNIKLDKAGGLTEAMKIAAAAEAAGLKVMVGCMLSTSLGIAPAFLVAQRAHWVDLDGPALLAEDREEHFRFEGGKIIPPA